MTTPDQGTDHTNPHDSTPDDSNPHDSGPERVGSVAQEALKLFLALGNRGAGNPGVGNPDPGAQASATQGSAGRHSASASGSVDAEDQAATHVCSASWCPVCQMVGFVKDNPEALAEVSRSAAQLATSLRNLFQGATTPQEKP